MDKMMKVAKFILLGFVVLIIIGMLMPTESKTVSKPETKSETVKVEEKPQSTMSKVKESLWDTQAKSMAERYLNVSAFSHDGLIEQLVVGSDFTTEQATKAVNSLNVDWNEQALRMAKRYLEVSSFSKDGLVEQLVVGSQFTKAQAQYAVSNI
jgi:hypothetical protein